MSRNGFYGLRASLRFLLRHRMTTSLGPTA